MGREEIKLKKLLCFFLLLPSLALAGQGMGPGPGVKGYGASASCQASPFVSQTNNSGQQTLWDGDWQVLKASDVSGKVVCKACVTIGLINTSPWVFTIKFVDDATGATQYGDTSEQISASTESTEYCAQTTWTSGTKPTLPNANVRMVLTTVSGQARIALSADSTGYQDSSYDFLEQWATLSKDAVFRIYNYQ
jgi:hypothetical protein